jgi:hypothetical protein
MSFLPSYYCLPVGNVAALGRRPLRDAQVPQFASLELIHETVHPQVLPAIRPRRLHRHRIDNIIDLRAHARLNDLRQCFRLRDVLEVERAGERGKRRQPARKWRRRGRWGGVSRGSFETSGSAATVGMTDDENCDRARDGFSERACKQDGGGWGGNAEV